MGYKKNPGQVAFKYEFDRLGKQKMEQVYDILLSKLLQGHKKNALELVQGGKNR